MALRILAAISGHGFGHATQACLTLNRLRETWPNIELLVRSQVSSSFLHSRLHPPFSLKVVQDDFGMIMRSAIDVDIKASCLAYREFHQNWEKRVEQLAQHLSHEKIDLVLADVPYLPLAAAQQVGIPAVALCSLNWADIYWHYCKEAPDAGRIDHQIRTAYRSAHYFFQPAPSMPMSDLHKNTYPVGPLARLGVLRRTEIAEQLNIPTDCLLALIGMGGMDMDISLTNWPEEPKVYWLIPEDWQLSGRKDCFGWEKLAMPFIDVLRSVDVLITKPGYGSFAEAACNGIPVIYVEREDWPESVALINWLEQHTLSLRLSRQQLESGAFISSMKQLLNQPRPPIPQPTGAQEIVERLFPILSRRSSSLF